MKIRVFLVLLTVSSFLLRLVQARMDYTGRCGDESVLAQAALDMMVSGNFKDLFFGYGDVLKIPYLLLNCLYFLYGVWKGAFDQVATLMPLEGFIYVDRLMNITTGALAIPVAYALGKKIFSPPIGWVLALLVFANPLQFRYSLYANPDNTAFFFHLLCILYALDIGSSDDRINRRGYFLAGLFAALSIGSKVNHGLALLLPVLMHFLNRRENFLRKMFSPNFLIFLGALFFCYWAVTPTGLLSLNHYFYFWVGFFFYSDMAVHPQPIFTWLQFTRLGCVLEDILGNYFLVALTVLGTLGMFRDAPRRRLFAVGLTLVFLFTPLLDAGTNYGVDAHFFFPLLPYLLIFVASGINLVVSIVQKQVPRLSHVASLTLALVLIFFPFKESIVNAEKDFNYLGGPNKESFIQYLKTGQGYECPLPMVSLFENERECLKKLAFGALALFQDPSFEDSSKWEKEWWVKGKVAPSPARAHSGKHGLALEGTETCLMTVFPRKQMACAGVLSFWIWPECRSELLPSSLTVRVKAVKYLGEERQPLGIHENRYSLLARGPRNWRENGIPLPQEPAPGRWTQIALPIRDNLEREGIRWADVDFLLLKVELLSPYETLRCSVDDLEWN